MQAEEREDPDEERRHPEVHRVERGIVDPVPRVRVRLVLGELYAHARVALLACGEDPPRGKPGPRVGFREHVVVPVAVVAGRDVGGHVRPAQGHCLAMVGLAVVGQAGLMAFPADLVALRLEGLPRRHLDLVGAVAVCADRSARVPLCQECPVDALVVGRLDAQVALAARLSDVRVVRARALVHAALDVVNAVAVVA